MATFCYELGFDTRCSLVLSYIPCYKALIPKCGKCEYLTTWKRTQDAKETKNNKYECNDEPTSNQAFFTKDFISIIIRYMMNKWNKINPKVDIYL